MKNAFSRTRALAAASVVSVLCALVPSHAGAQQPLQVVRVALNLSTYNNLPIFLAVDKGYFKDVGLDVQITGFNGSSTAQIPRLARGDADIMGLALGPAFFNQFNEGFNIKLVAALSGQRTGWNATTWLVVRQDLWDSRAIRKPADLRGKAIDGVAPGSPLDFLALTTIAAGGLAAGDVTFTEKYRDPPTWLGALRNRAVDVQGLPEPVATDMQEQKIAHKWLGLSQMAPWFDDGFIGSSAAFARDHHDALVRFLRGYLRANQDIRRANGKWTPDLVASVAKWTSLPEATIRQIPGPAYPTEGRINNASIAHQEDFWHARGLVANVVPPGAFIDTSTLQEAMRSAK